MAGLGDAVLATLSEPDSARWLDPRPTDTTRLLLTWGGEETGTTEVNVTGEEALRLSGPLALLWALRLQEQNDFQGSLQKAVTAARQAGSLRLWLLGANSTLEPQMAWEELLMGPLPASSGRVVEAFNVQAAPFAGESVSVVFCNPFTVPDRTLPVAKTAAFRQEFRTTCSLEVDDVPHLAMALHPGLAKYPESWAITLKELALQGVPLLVIDTGDTAGRYYEFHESVHPEDNSEGLQLPGDWKLLRQERRFFRTEKFPGGIGEMRLLEQVKAVHTDASGRSAVAHSLASLREATYYADDGRFLGRGEHFQGLPSTEKPWQGQAVQEWPQVCSDSEGTLFMGRKLGFVVGLLAVSPFHYCENFPLCQSSRIMTVLEPMSVFNPDLEQPVHGHFHDVASKAVNCYSEELQPCMQELLSTFAADPAVRQDALAKHTVASFLQTCIP